MANVPFLDLKAANVSVREELETALSDVLDSGQFITGRQLEAFENEFAAFQGVKGCVGAANGLDALHLSLRVLNIGPGDEVIVPAHTFIATWLAVTYAGASIVPIDVEKDNGNLDPRALTAAITNKTRAIIPVHLYGRICDMLPIQEIARQNKIHVIEDAAQAHGAEYRGERAGAFSDLAGFSFYPGKNLGALGDAGAVVSNDKTLLARIRRLGNYGSDQRYQHMEAGLNSRLDELQAAFLRVKLKRLDAWNIRRREIATWYLSELKGLPIQLPVADTAESVSSWHLFVIRSQERDRLAAGLIDKGIGCLRHYPIPPFLQGAYAHYGWRGEEFPEAKKWADECLSLPIDPIMTDNHVDTVIHAVKEELQ